MCNGAAREGSRNIESGEGAVFEVMQKAVMAGGVIVFADDLAAVIDADGLGSVGGQGVVQCGESVAAQEEAVLAPGVDVESDNLACIVDASSKSATARPGGRGIVDGDKAAAAQEEAVRPVTRVAKLADDLARVVDAECSGERGRGTVDRGEDVDGHVVASSSPTVRASSGHRPRIL